MCFIVAGCDCSRRFQCGGVVNESEGNHNHDDVKCCERFDGLARAVVNTLVGPSGAPCTSGPPNTLVSTSGVHGVGWDAGVRNRVDPRGDARGEFDPELDSGVHDGVSNEGARNLVTDAYDVRGRGSNRL
jgi:hypothetical protein